MSRASPARYDACTAIAAESIATHPGFACEATDRIITGEIMSAVLQNDVAPVPDTQPMTDGFHLVIDALKHNGIDTIFGLVGIPITDLARLAQA
jgi:hypothetical protein